MLFAFALLAFVCGALIVAWLAVHWQPRRGIEMPDMLTSSPTTLSEEPAAASPKPVESPATAATVDAQAARIAELEQRLGRITVAAQSASYNANRAEAILTAFAARRALDTGRPLGYVEGALRVRFGEAQPKAVATIINAAAEPVTLADLRLNLQDIVAVPQGQPGESWLNGIWREVQGIAVVRRAGTPSSEPSQRLQRAYRAIDAGQVDVAIRELSALPEQPQLTRWLELARRYNEAHRALDVIEAAAILEPRNTPVTETAAVQPPAVPAQPAPSVSPAPQASAPAPATTPAQAQTPAPAPASPPGPAQR
jgi:hypothetical protein